MKVKSQLTNHQNTSETIQIGGEAPQKIKMPYCRRLALMTERSEMGKTH
jgi:hypothetical protein